MKEIKKCENILLKDKDDEKFINCAFTNLNDLKNKTQPYFTMINDLTLNLTKDLGK